MPQPALPVAALERAKEEIKMTPATKIRALPAMSFTEMELAQVRIRQLEQQCSRLSEQLDRMNPIVEIALTLASCEHCDGWRHLDALQAAVLLYKQKMERAMRETA